MSAKYTPKTLVGNFFEDQVAKDEEMKEYLKKKESGKLSIMWVQKELAGSLQPVELTRADGEVHLNDVLSLVSSATRGALAADTGDFIGNELEQLYMVTTCPDVNPYSRSAWRVVRYRDEDRVYPDPGKLHYGEKFHLVSHPSFHRQPLYLYSTMKSIQNASKLSSEQLVALGTKPGWNTVWCVVPRDPAVRKSLDGDPVPSSADVLLLHCATNNYLSAHGASYRNVFGKENEVFAAKKLDSHRCEETIHVWRFSEGSAASSLVSGADNAGAVAGGASAGHVDPEETLETVRRVLAKRSNGFSSLKALGKQFRIADRHRDGRLTRRELSEGLGIFLRGYGVRLSAAESEALFDYVDRNNDGKVDYDEFLRAIRGDMNEVRVAYVRKAFAILDSDGSGVVTLDEIKAKYDVTGHPKVLDGSWTKEKAIRAFAADWDRNGDDSIPFEEFREYYEWVSPSLEKDEEFTFMIVNAWHISGDAVDNTSCRRVLVHHRDGTQSVEEIKNDLGIGPQDTDKMMRNLRDQGFDPVKIELYS